MKTLLYFAFAYAILLGALHAQPNAPTRPEPVARAGAVSGRVFNPATGEYVRNAEVRVSGTDRLVVTDDSGSFRIPDLPAGTAMLSVSFTGYNTATARVAVQPGQTVAQVIELTSSLAGTAADGQTVQLSQFTVSAEREGNAKAIMDQRAAMNVKNVVASDVFGDVA